MDQEYCGPTVTICRCIPAPSYILAFNTYHVLLNIRKQHKLFLLTRHKIDHNVLNSCILNLFLSLPAIWHYTRRESQRAISTSLWSPQVGNLNGRRHEVVPSSIGSSQPIPVVRNLVQPRYDLIPDSEKSGLARHPKKTRKSKKKSFHNRQPSHQSPCPWLNETSVLSRPKRPQRTIIQTSTFIEAKTESHR